MYWYLWCMIKKTVKYWNTVFLDLESESASGRQKSTSMSPQTHNKLRIHPGPSQLIGNARGRPGELYARRWWYHVRVYGLVNVQKHKVFFLFFECLRACSAQRMSKRFDYLLVLSILSQLMSGMSSIFLLCLVCAQCQWFGRVERGSKWTNPFLDLF